MLFNKLIKNAEQGKYLHNHVVDDQGTHLFERFYIFKMDEHWSHGRLRSKLPWYCPFNIFLHRWENTESVTNMHDHPRWSITIMLRGRMRETDLKNDVELKAGSVVFRWINNPHIFTLNKDQKGKVWTLFIVGRRKYTQYVYDLKGKKLGQMGGIEDIQKDDR